MPRRRCSATRRTRRWGRWSSTCSFRFRSTSICRRFLAAFRARDTDAHIVNENRTKDGRIIICEWFNTPLFNAEGTYVGVICLGQDVTGRIRANEALARDALLLANVRDSVIVTNMDGIVTFWNEGATRLFGWRADEMLERPLLERVPASARVGMAAAIESVRDGKEFVGAWEDYRKDGSQVRAEEELKRQKEILQTIFDHIGRHASALG